MLANSNFIVRVTAIFALFVITACAPMGNQVPVAPERSFHRGFSLFPPNEGGWVYHERNANSLIMAKSGSTRGETYAITTSSNKLPSLTSQSEFIEAVRTYFENGTDPSRQTIINHDISAYPEKGDCTRSHAVLEDRVPQRTGGVRKMILEVISLTCRHPDNAKLALTASYSYRHFPGHVDANWSEAADVLFESFQFTDL